MQDPADGAGPGLSKWTARRVFAKAGTDRRAGGGRSRLRRRQHQDGERCEDRRHHHRDEPAGRGSRSRVSRKSSRWSSPGLYPVEAISTRSLRDALEKLRLNDSSFFFEPETSMALGFGFRCGFLGLLHMEIVQERLEREFNMDLDHHRAGRALPRHDDRRAARSRSTIRRSCPKPQTIDKIEEPIITRDDDHPHEFVGAILKLCSRRSAGVQKMLEYSELEPRPGHLRAAVQRNRARLLRSAEVAARAAMRRSTITVTGYWTSPTSSSWTSWSTASRSTRFR